MKNKIDAILQNHEKRIAQLESLLSNKNKPLPKSENKESLSDYILSLRDKKFFAQPKTASDTHIKLKENYHCEENRVAVALFRLSERKQLRKATKTIGKNKYQSYVW